MTEAGTGPARIDLGGGTTALLVRAGTWLADPGALFGPVPRALWSRQAGGLLDADGRLPQAANCLVLDAPGGRVLVDSGPGDRLPVDVAGRLGWQGPAIVPSLAALGIEPASIDVLIVNNLRRLHAGGLLEAGGGPAFPRARLVVQGAEWTAARSNSPRFLGTYDSADLAKIEAGYDLEIVDGDAEIVAGVSVVRSGGCTAGHQVVVARGDGPGAVTLASPGDLLMRPWNANPRWIAAFDDHPVDAVRVKGELLDRAARQGWLVLLAHEPERPVGRLVADGSRHRFEPI